MAHESSFQCSLPNGLHARPASLIAETAGRFAAQVTLTNERTAAAADAKSVLAIVALDVKMGDTCRLRVAGSDADADRAHAALRDFAHNVLPGCDEPGCADVQHAATEVVLPRALRNAGARWIAGTVVCPGLGQGVVVVVGGLSMTPVLANERPSSPQAEGERVRGAISAVRTRLGARLAAGPPKIEADILSAHLAIASDVGLEHRIGEALAEGRAAGCAVVEAARYFAARLLAADSAYVRERAVDVEDIGQQILEEIYGERVRIRAIDLAEPSIVVAENLTPRQFLALDKRWLRALVLEHAGVTSHAVILARSFGIPTITSVADVRANVSAGREAIVDANLGIVIANVAESVRRFYEREHRKHERRHERIARHTQKPAVTRDGVRMDVAANVATAVELAPAFARGADGIGLFRTEMLFLDRDAPPSEEEQFAIYVQAARAAAGKPVIIRTFDVGGDKPLPYLHLPAETNPFLGYRGARIYPDHRDVFAAQLRAILRASAFGNVWVMLPMISALDEILWVKREIAAIQGELTAVGLAFDPNMRVGIMIEVPSIAFMIDKCAAEVDFFSIGTNDLMQYFHAVDRDSTQVAALSSARDPAFLRLLAKIVGDARAHGRWIGMCGEMTRSPRNLPLLVGLGLDEISMAAPEIPASKAAIAALSAAECRALLERTMACNNAAEVESLVAEFRGRSTDHDLLDPEFVVVDSDSRSKEEAIGEILDAFYAAGRTDRPQAIEDAVWAREAVYTTGLGHGFAIPHCKTDAIAAHSIGIVRLSKPIDWGALDGEPVRCVILLAMRASDASGTHMRVFSKLARKLMHEDFRERLLSAPDRAAVLSLLEEFDVAPAEGEGERESGSRTTTQRPDSPQD